MMSLFKHKDTFKHNKICKLVTEIKDHATNFPNASCNYVLVLFVSFLVLQSSS